METVTQALLGAVIGLAGFQYRLGYKAVVWGALAGAVANLDSIAYLIDGQFAEFTFRRGWTHSILWPFLLGPLFAWLNWNLYRRKPPSVRPIGGQNTAYPFWALLWILGMLSHLLVDLVAGPGVRLLLPFTGKRFALYGLTYVDVPLLTLLVLCIAICLALRRYRAVAATVAGLSLIGAALYGVLAVNANGAARDRLAETLDPSLIAAGRLYTGPTLYQPFLRRVVLIHPDEVWIGQMTLAANDPGTWSIVASADGPDVSALRASRAGRIFDNYADGIVLAQRDRKAGTRVELVDLRYADPGAALTDGRWKIAADVAADGEIVPPFVAIRTPAAVTAAQLDAYWRSVRGESPAPAR